MAQAGSNYSMIKLEVKNLVGLSKKSKINFDHYTLIVLTILYQAKSIIICIEATVHTVYTQCTHRVHTEYSPFRIKL